MNNSALEQALVNGLIATGFSAPVQAGSSAEQITNDGPTVIVSVPEIQHVVGPLHRATVHWIVSAPAYQTSEGVYRATVQAVRTAVAGFATNGLASALAGSGFGLAGLHVGDSSEQIEDTRWVNSLSMTLGLS
jgi:hypothetical protein